MFVNCERTSSREAGSGKEDDRCPRFGCSAFGATLELERYSVLISHLAETFLVTHRLNRRELLRSAAVLSTPWILPQSLLAQSPNERLNHACIGVDGMGWGDLGSLASHPRIQIVAICDVDVARMEKAAARFPQARRYQDWRELLAMEEDRIDSVNVSVPDHMHADISRSAISRGKHVYCQKPLTHDVAEARGLRIAAERAGVTTQMGNQIQSADVYRTAVRMLQDGVIGKVKAIHAWTGATFPQRGRPAGADPVPASLDWDKWLGVAPDRPFKSGVYHPFNWRGWQDFGGGAIGDFGCHILDTPFKALGLTAPTSIRAEVPTEWAENEAWRLENWPDWEILTYEFPGTELTSASTLEVIWYDGGKQPPIELFGFQQADQRPPGSGALFLGDDGKLLLPHVGAPNCCPAASSWDRPYRKWKASTTTMRSSMRALVEEQPVPRFVMPGPLPKPRCWGRSRCDSPGRSWSGMRGT